MPPGMAAMHHWLVSCAVFERICVTKSTRSETHAMLARIFDRFGFYRPRLLPGKAWKTPWSVSASDNTITVTDRNGALACVALHDLQAVRIQTTSDGPFFSDVWWWLLGTDGTVRCVFPNDAAGADKAVGLLSGLDGFSHRAMVAAMGSTDNAWFPVWVRRPQPVNRPVRPPRRPYRQTR